MQVDEQETILMSKEQALDKITTFMGGRAAEEVIFNRITSGASNDIEQSTKIATGDGFTFRNVRKFDMMALETVNNQYLGGDTSLLVSSQTLKLIMLSLKSIITCHQNN